MANKNYSEKLRDPRWQRKRLEVMQRDNFFCQCCGDPDSTLNVHHFQYHGDPWETPNELLITLCEQCHSNETEGRALANKNLLSALNKGKFLHYNVDELAKGFNDVVIVYAPEVTASIISWAVSNKEVMSLLGDMFFADLSKDREVKHGG